MKKERRLDSTKARPPENGEDNADPSGLSVEQADTDRLLRQLLGTAIADRYADFCHLASGRLQLAVSRPLAGHAMRELDSLIRHVLAVPMDARAVDNPKQSKLRADARRALFEMGFDEAAVQRAEAALKPRLSHKVQIKKLVTRLGLAPDGDVATLWIKLNEAYGRAHERSFHERLEVDEAFRTQYARRFDSVIRALAVQLQGSYSALMRRAKDIAAMPPAKGIKLFMSEIPGAIQLQGFFYENLQSDAWLPFLEQEGLLKEPVQDAQAASGLGIWAWPVGRYLVRMASSNAAATRMIVERALRVLASSTHPDVQRLGLDTIAALPADEAAALTDVVSGWLTPETAHFHAAPHKIIATLAQASHAEAAIRVVEAVFQVFQRDGELASFFDPTMYEHYMKAAVNHLSRADPLLAIPRFSDLLLHASRMDRRLGAVEDEDYSYHTLGSLQPDQMGGGDVLATLIRAIAQLATAAVESDPANVRRVLDLLSRYKPRIFRRIMLHVLAMAPSEAPDVADRYLTDTVLIEADWCRQEYAELARAWLNDLPTHRQRVIFDFIDSVPERFLDTWHANFERYEKRKPTAEDDRKYCETTIREIVWEWRDALPSDRRAALDKSVAEFGDPDAWRERYFARDQSPLSRASMQSQTVEDTVAYLETWRPDPQLQTLTAGGLANELREAAAGRPDVFSAGAAKFGRLRPLLIRHLLDGLRQSTTNGARVDWGQCLELIKCILERSEAAPDSWAAIPGDDPDWSWAVRSAVEWLASALGRGADGVAFVHADTVRMVVLGLYCRVGRFPATERDVNVDRKHPHFAALRTTRGAAINLCVMLLSWQSRDPASTIGQAPRDALALAPDIGAIFETELRDRSPSSWIPRAILGRYLTWLFFFGEDWLRSQMTNLFPPDNKELRNAAWVAHLQNDQQPVGELVGALHPCYAEHIAGLGRNDAPPGYEESKNRFVDHLMILYLWEQLPEDLLQQFWDSAPVKERRRAMWYIGRHMVSTNDLRTRAMSYWNRRFQAAVHSSDPEPYRMELGIIGLFFAWDMDPLWLMNQLLLTLNAGFGPTDAMGIIDNLAKQVPEKIDKVVEITKALVRQAKVEAWIFASEDQSLRKILVEGKKSSSPLTVAAVKEIVSYLSSRGNTRFLDVDE
jgi:hypothetical protein